MTAFSNGVTAVRLSPADVAHILGASARMVTEFERAGLLGKPGEDGRYHMSSFTEFLHAHPSKYDLTRVCKGCFKAIVFDRVEWFCALVVGTDGHTRGWG
jgi:hypothetical protein